MSARRRGRVAARPHPLAPHTRCALRGARPAPEGSPASCEAPPRGSERPIGARGGARPSGAIGQRGLPILQATGVGGTGRDSLRPPCSGPSTGCGGEGAEGSWRAEPRPCGSGREGAGGGRGSPRRQPPRERRRRLPGAPVSGEGGAARPQQRSGTPCQPRTAAPRLPCAEPPALALNPGSLGQSGSAAVLESPAGRARGLPSPQGTGRQVSAGRRRSGRSGAAREPSRGNGGPGGGTGAGGRRGRVTREGPRGCRRSCGR